MRLNSGRRCWAAIGAQPSRDLFDAFDARLNQMKPRMHRSDYLRSPSTRGLRRRYSRCSTNRKSVVPTGACAPLQHVAHAVGYQSEAAFQRPFKSYTGLTATVTGTTQRPEPAHSLQEQTPLWKASANMSRPPALHSGNPASLKARSIRDLASAKPFESFIETFPALLEP
jgi:AraC-like DNA-binding protein